ncbi:MAG: cupin domain-containing protein [Acetobacterium sp.]|uniref:cupin domain-containing protein n=1 Tax=Acetobacterium sp. TaxID=1872094 RepID=UPI0032429C1F
MSLRDYVLRENESILKALEKIDQNKKGFLIIVDHTYRVIGTLTDGDLRRSFIKEMRITDSISTIYNKKFETLSIYDQFNWAIQLFKNPKIEFLPITDNSGKLVNLITKKNLHVLLLSDIEFDWLYPFVELDDFILEHEIYDRPWGFYKTTFLNSYSQSKILNVRPSQELSLQEHQKREEYWIVISGIGEVVIGTSKKKIEAGSFIFVPKGCKHKLKNISKEQALMVAEVQLGEYFGEDDIVRYDSVYSEKEDCER